MNGNTSATPQGQAAILRGRSPPLGCSGSRTQLLVASSAVPAHIYRGGGAASASGSGLPQQMGPTSTPRVLPLMTPRRFQDCHLGASPYDTSMASQSQPPDLNSSSRTLPPTSQPLTSPKGASSPEYPQVPTRWPTATQDEPGDELVHVRDGSAPPSVAMAYAGSHASGTLPAAMSTSTHSPRTPLVVSAQAYAATNVATLPSTRSPRTMANLAGASKDKLISVILQLENDLYQLQRRVDDHETERQKDRNALQQMVASVQSLHSQATGATGETRG